MRGHVRPEFLNRIDEILSLIHIFQMTGLGVQNFVSAGTGIAVMSALIRGLERRCASTPVSYTHLDVYKRQDGGSFQVCPGDGPGI